MTSFSKQVSDYVKVYEKRLRAVARTAVQETIAEAQTPVAKGGRMRVDTNFLRSSLVSAVGQMPYGETKGGEGPYQYTGESLSAALLRWDPNKGETFYSGWSANYARPREYKDGFLRGATQNWSIHVDKAAKSAMQIKS